MARRLAVLVVVLIAAACGDGDVDGTGSGAEGTSGSTGDGATIMCPNGLSFPVAALDSIEPVAERPDMVAAVDAYAELTNWSGPSATWWVLHETGSTAEVVASDGAVISWFRLTGGDGAWSGTGAAGFRGCPLLLPLPDDLGLVDWTVDPATDPSSPTLVLAATEQACVGGLPMGDRLVIVEVVETPTEVGVVLGAEPPPGDAFDCPGNPTASVRIDLDDPLGDRVVRNGLAWGADLAELIGALDDG